VIAAEFDRQAECEFDAKCLGSADIVQILMRADDASGMDAIQSALSGMQSAQRSFATSAHNVANLLTEDFRPLRTTQSARAGGGSTASVSQAPVPRPVDLTREVVSQIQSKTQYTASLRVFEAGAEMRGELIDLLA